MNGEILLDTNMVIQLFRQDPAVLSRMTPSVRMSIPCIVLGELFYGALGCSRLGGELRKIEALIAEAGVLACDDMTAWQYGQLKNALRAKGQPIPDNDIWIAALALQYGLPLASKDQHFEKVDGLVLERW